MLGSSGMGRLLLFPHRRSGWGMLGSSGVGRLLLCLWDLPQGQWDGQVHLAVQQGSKQGCPHALDGVLCKVQVQGQIGGGGCPGRLRGSSSSMNAKSSLLRHSRRGTGPGGVGAMGDAENKVCWTLGSKGATEAAHRTDTGMSMTFAGRCLPPYPLPHPSALAGMAAARRPDPVGADGRGQCCRCPMRGWATNVLPSCNPSPALLLPVTAVGRDLVPARA